MGRSKPAGHSGEDAAVAGDDGSHALAGDEAARGLDALDASAFDGKAGDLAILNNVDAERAGGAREAPGDRIVACGASPSLQQSAGNGVVAVEIDEGDDIFHLLGRQELGIDPVQVVCVAAAPDLVHLVLAVGQEHQTALREHQIEVELLAEPLPQPHGVLVESRRFIGEVVGADDRRVAAGVAAPDPALLQHSDIVDAVLPGEVVGGCKAVTAADDDDDVVAWPGRGIAPRRSPASVGAEAAPQEAEDRVALHGAPSPLLNSCTPARSARVSTTTAWDLLPCPRERQVW